MAKITVQPGDVLTAKVHEDMKKQFKGKVMKNYEHAAMLEITEFDAATDGPNIPELNGRIVVSLKNVRAVNGKRVAKGDEVVPVPAEEPETPMRKRA